MYDTYIEIEERIKEIFDQATQDSLGSYDEIDFYDEDDFYDDTYNDNEEIDLSNTLEEISDIVSTEAEDFLINRNYKDLFKLYYFLSHLMQEVLDTEISHSFYEELYDIRESLSDTLKDYLLDGSENDKKEFFNWALKHIDYLVDDTYEAEYNNVEDYILATTLLDSSNYRDEFIEAYRLYIQDKDEEKFVKDHPDIFAKYLKALTLSSEDRKAEADGLKDKYSNMGILEL